MSDDSDSAAGQVFGPVSGPLPRHIAVVMDGNGRWANKRHLPRAAGHKAGVNATRRIVENCAKNNIEALTIFAFSSENWNRPKSEVSSLMSLFVSTLTAEVKKLHKKNVRVQFIGERLRFSQKLQKSISESELLTKNNTGLKLTIAANYGGRWDIVNACKLLLQEIQNNQSSNDLESEHGKEINEQMLASFLALNDTPEPDLFIRTGGEKRISNFLLWQLAYSELHFVDTLWPDFSDENFTEALNWFAGRQRRFGKTGKQIQNEQAVASTSAVAD